MNPENLDHCQLCLARQSCAFSRLPDDVRREFQDIVCTKFYVRGTSVVRQGDAAHGLYIVKSGVLRQLQVTPSGKATTVKLSGPSEMVGLTELLAGESYSMSAEAVEDCRLEYVAREQFLSFLYERPGVAVELLTWLSREFHEFLLKLCGTTAKDPLAVRLWQNLQGLSRSCGRSTREGVALSSHLTVPDLAYGLGCSRQWTSKLLGELESEGRIKRRGRQVVLPRSTLRINCPEENCPEEPRLKERIVSTT